MSASALPTKTVLWIAGTISLFAWVLTVPLASWVASPKPEKQNVEGYTWPENPGVVGDSFGPLTCLFSGFSFCLLIYSFMREREDAAEEKHLLKLQLIEAKAEAYTKNVSFFVITLDLYGITILNYGPQCYFVHLEVWTNTLESGDKSVLISTKTVPFWDVKHPESLRLDIIGARYYLLKIAYVMSDGNRTRENHIIDNLKPNFFSCTNKAQHANDYRALLESSGPLYHIKSAPVAPPPSAGERPRSGVGLSP